MSDKTHAIPLDAEDLNEHAHLLADWYWECNDNFQYTKIVNIGETSDVDEIANVLIDKEVWAQDVFFALNLDSGKLERKIRAGEVFRGVLAGYAIGDKAFYVSISGKPRIDVHNSTVGYCGFASIVSELQDDYVILRQFRTAMDESGDAIYMADVKTLKFVDVNATACRRMGYTREQMLTLGPSDLLSVSPETIRQEYMELIRSGGRGIKSESIAYSRSGSRMIAEMHRRPVKVGGRWVVISIARDITQRKSSELANIRKSQMYSVLSSAEEAMVRANSLLQLFENVCSAVVEGESISTMAIFQLDGEKKVVEFVAGSGNGAGFLDQVSLVMEDVDSFGGSLLGRACTSGLPVTLGDNLEGHQGIAGKELAAKFSPTAAVAIPFMRDLEFAGVALFCSHDAQWFDSEIVYILQRMMRSLVHALDKLELQEVKQKDHDRFEYMANYDALTELPNRKYFLEKLEETITSARRSQRQFALMFIDLDGFKAINDNYGHDYGDALLKEIAARFCGVLRENDCVARLGGDEFVVIAADAHTPESLTAIAEKLLREAGKPVIINTESCIVSASIGISLYTDRNESSDELLKRADGAMYVAKSEGKNRYSISQ